MFRIGTRVVWRDTTSHHLEMGKVVNVVPCDDESPESTLYDVDFAFGRRTLHGAELSSALLRIPTCAEEERLQTIYENAFDVYVRGTFRMADVAGTIAHAEFEYLVADVVAARQTLGDARKRLMEHIAEHGC